MQRRVSSRAPGRGARNGFVKRVVGLVAAIGVAFAVVSPIGAEDACRTSCDDWLASCLKSCADAPVADDCRANCRKLDRMCLYKCDQP